MKTRRKRKQKLQQILRQEYKVNNNAGLITVMDKKIKALNQKLDDIAQRLQELEHANKKLRFGAQNDAIHMDELTKEIGLLKSELNQASEDRDSYKILWDNRKHKNESTGRPQVYGEDTGKEFFELHVYGGKTIREIAAAESEVQGITKDGKPRKLSTTTVQKYLREYERLILWQWTEGKRSLDTDLKRRRAELKYIKRILPRLQRKGVTEQSRKLQALYDQYFTTLF